MYNDRYCRSPTSPRRSATCAPHGATARLCSLVFTRALAARRTQRCAAASAASRAQSPRRARMLRRASRRVFRRRSRRARRASRSIRRARPFSSRCGPLCAASDPARRRPTRSSRAAIGAPTAVRAVGAANGANPIWLIIPCHRADRLGWPLGRLRRRPRAQTLAARPRSRPTPAHARRIARPAGVASRRRRPLATHRPSPP